MNKLSFKELIEEYNVVIPMLQRDYAYGRTGEVEKRENFLRNLKAYFSDNDSHELDFIYGSVDKNSQLVLLDGQQRITTLFLLHWYLSLVKDLNGDLHFEEFREFMSIPDRDPIESKFTYKTRYSSADFCNALISLNSKDVDKYAARIEAPGESLSNAIKQEKWFLPHWDYDPTIKSMLNMLDSIKQFFKPGECSDYYFKLKNNKQLSFNFLNLDDFKLTDELYIKMNSRGRALTRFENLKSKLLKLYDDAEKEVRPKYYAKLRQVNKDNAPKSYKTLRDYVSFMIDTKWTDVFWNEWLGTPEHGDMPNVDDMMLSFIACMAIFTHIIFKMNGKLSLARKDELTSEINALMSAKDKNKGITIRYDTLVEMFKEDDYALLFSIIDYFNIFNNDGKLKTYLPNDFTIFDEKDAFAFISNDYTRNELGYEKKAKMFAYVKYLSLNPNPDRDHFKSWMRFVCNVCSNSYNIENTTDTFCTAIAGLNYLYNEDIVSTIDGKDLNNLATLDRPQIEEEILKMQLSSNNDWKDALINAEKELSYFEGRLRYPLIECCNVQKTDIANASKLNDFKQYVDKISKLFPDSTGCKYENELIRAMLSKGNYLMLFSSNNTLLKNADRDNSWKRFLKERPEVKSLFTFSSTNVDKRDYFKEVINDKAFNTKDVKGSLEKIAELRDDSIPMWRKLIIDYKDILENTDFITLGKDRFIRWNVDSEYEHKKDSEDNYEIDLIPGSAITGYHAELFTLAKYYELKGKQFATLGEVKYHKTKTCVEQPFFYLGNDDNPFVKAMYQDDSCFRLIFENGTEKNSIAFADVETELLAIAP